MKRLLLALLIILIFSSSVFVLTANAETNDDPFYRSWTLDAVTLISAESSGVTSITLNWENVWWYDYSYDGYKIYRATSANGKYSLIKKITDPWQSSYTDTTVTTGKKYYYKMCKYSDTYTYESVGFSAVKSATAVPAKVSFSAVSYAKNKITLKWDKAENGVNGYVIYRSSSKNGTYRAIKRINTRATTSYIDSGVTDGKFYYYKIKAFTTVNGKSLYGPESDIVRNKIDISRCEAYFIKLGSISTNTEEFEKLIRIKYANKNLTDKECSFYYCGMSYFGDSVFSLYIYANGLGDFTGGCKFKISPIHEPYMRDVSVTNSGIEVTWQQESGAYGYKIYRKIGNGSYTAVKTISDNSTVSWIDKDANKINTEYSYFVKAYTKNGSKYLFTEKSDSMSVKRIATPKLKSVSNEKGGMVLKWNAVKGAKSYDILRKTENGSWKYISNTTNTEYIDRNTEVGTVYTYTVCCSEGKREPRVSYYNPTGLKARRRIVAEGISQSSSSVKITWNKSTTAKGYILYRATSANGTYKKIATIKDNSTLSYTDKNLTFGKYYYYKIKPYSVKNGKTVYGDYGKLAKVRPTIGVVSINKTKAVEPIGARLTWGKVAKADGYQVYMSTSQNGTYERVATVSGNGTTYCTVSNLQNAKTYYFKIRGYRKVKGITYYGDFSTVKSCFIDVFGYEYESYYSRTQRIWGTDYYKDYTSSTAASKDMKTIKIKTWDIDSKGNKYTRYHYLTVHKNIASTVEQIFKEIYNGKEKFPIKSVGGYAWRGINSYSEHCEGLAIDINPNENAQFDGYTGKPKTGSFWKPGKNPYSITPDGDVVRTFRKYGFGWGSWFSNPDYMHFSYFGG